jgi:hypothetical protein
MAAGTERYCTELSCWGQAIYFVAMETENFLSLLGQALQCPLLTEEDLRFLHTLHLRLLAHGAAAISDDERQRLWLLVADARERDDDSR